MYIEAVTVCIGYDDFLLETIPYNIPHLDRWLIVTRPEDKKTREVCRRFNLDVLLSDDGHPVFSKGRLIERGLQHLSANGWRLHLDADIALPNRFKHLLQTAEVNEDSIYGVDRVMVRSWQEWKKLQATGFMHSGYDYQCRINLPDGLNIGTRWGALETGYCPIGFFQLWHSVTDEWRGVRIKPYPTNHNSACRTDVQHALQWDRRKRGLIPEIIVVHLESEKCQKGINWNGRKSKRFGENEETPLLSQMQS